MSTTYVRIGDIGRATRVYPELVEIFKDDLLAGLRREATTEGMDPATETNVTWPPPLHFSFTADGMVECAMEDASFTRYYVEATYEAVA